MKKILLVLLTVVYTISSYGVDKKLLSDTLTSIAREHARVAKVTIDNIRVQEQKVSLYTNASLSHISFSVEEVQALRKLVSELVLGNPNGSVSIYSANMELDSLITSVHRDRPSNMRYTLGRVTPWVRNTSLPYSVTKGMSGKHIALWGSHGRYYNQKMQTWLWQRAKLWTTVEDVYTSSYTMPFLVPMLENAGAIVVQPRERDTQEVEQVVDEIEAIGYSEWAPGKDSGWGKDDDGILLEGENPFTKGSFAMTKTSEKSISELRYTPSLPVGEYAVYVSYKTLPKSSKQAIYTVVHRGQKTEFSVNQQMGGGTWVYLGTFGFDSDTTCNYVSLSNVGKGNSVVTADAVKFGGGMGNVARYPQPNCIDNVASSQTVTLNEEAVDSVQLAQNLLLAETSGMARYLEGARYWMQYAGIPDKVYNYTNSQNDYTDDYSARGRWVNYLSGGSEANPKRKGLRVPLHMSFSFHSDAGVNTTDTVIGTLMIYTDHGQEKHIKNFPKGCSRQVNRDLGDFIQTQITQDMCTLYTDGKWQRRHLQNGSYSETRQPQIPSVLLELLSHQNMTDMRYGLDPRVKFAVSRAIYKGMLRFLHKQYGTECVIQPLPVQQMTMSRAGQQITVTWKATHDKLEETAKPTYYVVYMRKNDGDWDNGTRVSKSSYTFTAEPDTHYAVRVAAGNAGGISLPSETLSAYLSSKEKGQVLVLNAFTRISGPEWFEAPGYAGIRPQTSAVAYGKDISYIGEQYEFNPASKWQTDDNCGFGSCYSDQQAVLTMGNTFDYPYMHGKSLAKLGYSYISANAYAIDSIAKENILVDVIMGKQKLTVLGTDKSFKTFTPKLQDVLTKYLDAGGNMLLSGAYIASDMQSDEEKLFIQNKLHYQYRCDHGSKMGVLKVNNRVLTPEQFTFYTSPNEYRIHTDNPDCIMPTSGAICVARFGDTHLPAAVSYDGKEQGLGKTLCWSLMLEGVDNFEQLYNDCINWLID